MNIIDWLKAVLRGEEDERGPEGDGTVHGLSVPAALKAHHDWVKRFEESLRSGGEDLNPDEIACDDRCILGRWIYDQKATHSALAALPLFEDLRTTHAVFHRTACLLAWSIRRREKQEAQLLLELVRKKSRDIRIALARLIIEDQDRIAG